MIRMRSGPTTIVEAVTIFFESCLGDASIKEVAEGVAAIFKVLSVSSISACLSSNTPKRFRRMARGRYRIAPCTAPEVIEAKIVSSVRSAPAISKGPKRETKGAPAVVELCAGGGGMALGLEQAGFEPRALIELDPHACATLRRNRPYWNVVQADMRRFDASYWCGTDLLSGGLPCPPFSIAGKQLGADDERDLFPSMLRIVQEVRPRALLIENVRGILTERFAPFRANVDAALKKQGFDTWWVWFNAAEFAVPQNRFRAFLIALRRGETKPLQWPIPTSGSAPTVADAIGDLMASRGWRRVSEWIKQAQSPAPTIVGGSHKHGGPDLGPTRARREWAELGVDGLALANEPPAKNFAGMPRLTIPMVARLQSFPDDWVFAGAKTQAYRQVGNALPVKLASAMAKAVRECLA
ncbi:MAG: DNA (cytosine-5-)-methyltransferase [Rhodomicrobium sp.]